MIGRFTIEGRPTTKKTSSQIVSWWGRDPKTGQQKQFHKLLPAENYLQWAKDAITQSPEIRRSLERQGFLLPISCPVAVNAQFYRMTNIGDLLGYEQALADWMQASNKHRSGAGIIVDDVLIYSWDGSRLAKDSARPRIDVLLSTDQEQLHLEA